MTQPSTTHRALTPPAILLPRVVPRTTEHAVPSLRVTRRQAHTLDGKIDWAQLVLAAWQLPAWQQYTGTLPPGISSQQFWAKVTRAARRMHGEVGIAVRGRQWWVWRVRRGKANAGKNNKRLKNL